jgi:hypothetical protein
MRFLGQDSTDSQPASGVALATPTSAQSFLTNYATQANYYQTLMNQAFMANVQAQADTYASTFQNTVVGGAWVGAITQCASYLATTYPNQTVYQTISNYLFVNPGFLNTAYQSSSFAQTLTVQSVYQFLTSMQTGSSLTFPNFTSNFYATDVPYMLNILTPLASSAYAGYSSLNNTTSNNVSTNTTLQNVAIEIQQWAVSMAPQAVQYGITPIQLSDIINNAQAAAVAVPPTTSPGVATSISNAPAATPPVSAAIVTSSNITSQIPASVPSTGVVPPVSSVAIAAVPATAMISPTALTSSTPDPTTQAIEQAAATAPVSIPLSQAISPTSNFSAGIMGLSQVQVPQTMNQNLPIYIVGGLIAAAILLR